MCHSPSGFKDIECVYVRENKFLRLESSGKSADQQAASFVFTAENSLRLDFMTLLNKTHRHLLINNNGQPKDNAS